MAIEDAFQLVNDLVSCVSDAAKARRDPDIEGCLRNYQAQRVVRVSAIHGMAGMAAFMASTYKVSFTHTHTHTSKQAGRQL